MDLQAYLNRIGFNKPIASTVEVLSDLVRYHTAAIPFENLNPWLGLPVDIEPEAVEQKLVRDGRGGYCYEHNTLLREALQAIGFEVTGLAARVLFMRQDDSLPARSHMLLRVDIKGLAYIADAGFGGATPTTALRLVEDVEQESPHEPYRLLLKGTEWHIEVLKNGAWETMYAFDLQPQLPIDYTFPNYYVSTHANSHFRNNLMAARAVKDGRFTLNNTQISFHASGAAPERKLLENPSELVETLETNFGLNLTNLPDLETRLSRLFFNTSTV